MKKILFIILFFCSTTSFALFCPANFNQIDLGSTVEQVEKQCGKATATKTTKTENDKGPQEWNYYLNVTPTGDGTIKLVIAMVDDKVANLNINGIGLGSVGICGSPVNIGDTKEAVQDACGKPALITKAGGAPGGGPNPNVVVTETTELTYDATPPVILVFENGKLKGRK